jgi:hypothetical protein
MAYSGILLATIDSSAQLPSFFELSIIDQLDRMIEPALRHIVSSSLTHASSALPSLSSSPFIRFIHSTLLSMRDADPFYFDSLYILLRLVVEYRMLQAHDAGLAEHLYSLKRITGFTLGGGRIEHATLGSSRKLFSLLVIVLIPKVLRMKRGRTTKERAVAFVATAYEAASFVQQFRYLFNQSPYYEPLSALMDVATVKDSSESSGTAKKSSWAPTVFIALALYKLAQSLTSQREEQSLISTILRPQVDAQVSECPPSPPQRKPKSLIPPSDPKLCPICLQKRILPCASPAGFVYCYQCLLRAVRRDGLCPVSQTTCSETEIMRLLEDDFA